jgi:hypothetical protein
MHSANPHCTSFGGGVRSASSAKLILEKRRGKERMKQRRKEAMKKKGGRKGGKEGGREVEEVRSEGGRKKGAGRKDGRLHWDIHTKTSTGYQTQDYL